MPHACVYARDAKLVFVCETGHSKSKKKGLVGEEEDQRRTQMKKKKKKIQK